MDQAKKIIPFIIGVILIGIGIFTYFRTNELVRVCTEPATATVVNMREEMTSDPDSNEMRYLYYPIISYQAGDQTVQGELPSGGSVPTYSVNDTVEILYNPNKTEEFLVIGDNTSLAWIILVGIGVAFIGVGIFLVVKK